jgi:hypothetical protein
VLDNSVQWIDLKGALHICFRSFGKRRCRADAGGPPVLSNQLGGSHHAAHATRQRRSEQSLAKKSSGFEFTQQACQYRPAR